MGCRLLQACVVGDSCCPAVGSGDLLLISAGPNHYPTVTAVASEAKAAGEYLHTSQVTLP